MKWIYIFLAAGLFGMNFCSAQNIVPNYSFEQADSCPTNFNPRTYKYSLGCVSWGEAGSGTADYFNSCDTASISIGLQVPIMGVPLNACGYQHAFEGQAYTGIVVYDTAITWYKEYLIATIPPLQKDTAYKVTIHVSLADSSRYGVDGMGVLFTTYGSPNPYTSYTISESPQVDYTSYGPIIDTLNWTTLSGIFTADSAYTNIIIGVFKDAAHLHVVPFNDHPKINNPYSAYYYVDNIEVEKLSSTGILPQLIGRSVTVNPNPVVDRATIVFEYVSGMLYKFELYNSVGQRVQFDDNIGGNELKIQREGLPAGLYYFILRDLNNIIGSGKIIFR